MSGIRSLLLAVVVILFHTGTANAVLLDRGGGLIYDTELDVTWLQDAQYALTTGSASPGMSWVEATAWAANLVYFDSVRGTVIDDWRLPSTINSRLSSGFDTSGLSSELAYMYYVNLGYAANPNMDDTSVPAPSSGNYNPFINLAYLGYWSGTDGQIPDRQRSWALHFHFGYQALANQSEELRVWAVRDGDVGSAVPEPGDSLLFSMGIFAVLLAGRRRATAA